MNSKTLLITALVVGVLVVVLIFCLFRPSGLGIDYDAESFFEVRRLFFAAGVLAVLAFMLILSIAVYAGMSQAQPPNAAGKDIFDSMIKVVPPIITLVLGYYFGQQSIPKLVEKGAMTIAIADIIQDGASITTYVSGGTPPYRLTVDSADKTLIKDAQKTHIVETGWIKYDLANVPTGATAVTFTVSDSKNLKTSRKFDVKP